MIPYLVAPGRVSALAELVKEWKGVVLDCETTGLDLYLGDSLMGFAIGDLYGDACYYIPTSHNDCSCVSAKEIEVLRSATAGKPVIGHNIKFDIHASREVMGEFPGSMLFDTMVMARIMADTEKPFLDLETLTIQELGCSYQSEAAGKQAQFGKGKFTYEQIGMKCCEDVDFTRRLYLYFKEKMAPQLRRLFLTECRLSRVLYEMEHLGIAFNPKTVTELDNTLEELKGDVQKKIVEATGLEKFNPRSNPQITKLMASLGIEPIEYGDTTKKGERNPKWTREILAKIKHPVARLIAQHRALGYQQAYFLAWLKKCMDLGQHVLHGSFNNWGTVTGRLSSSDPNLQNMPRGWLQMHSEDKNEILHWDEEGPEREISLRKLFVPRPGYAFLVLDYRQLELFIGGFYLKRMGDESFCKLLESEDMHAATASLVFEVPLAKVTPDMRRQAKVFNFGLWFGMGDTTLAEGLGCSRKQAKEFRETFFRKVPGFPKLQRAIYSTLAKQEYLENVYGRRYYLPEEHFYIGINRIVQGSAGDYVKFRLLACECYCAEHGILLVLTTHDDVVFEVPKKLIRRRDVIQPLVDIMEEGKPFGMCLPVSVKVAENNLAEKEDLVYA